MKDYILFIPPADVSNTKPSLWSNREAKIYFDWFISIKDYRVEYLLTTIDETLTDNGEKDIKRIGKKVTELLFYSPFSIFENNKFVITNKGLAIVTDLSLLISKLIIDQYPQILWKIVKKPKRDISYNLPALFEFPLISHIEPIRGSIIEAKAILRGEKTEQIWLEFYEYIINLIE